MKCHVCKYKTPQHILDKYPHTDCYYDIGDNCILVASAHRYNAEDVHSYLIAGISDDDIIYLNLLGVYISFLQSWQFTSTLMADISAQIQS